MCYYKDLSQPNCILNFRHNSERRVASALLLKAFEKLRATTDKTSISKAKSILCYIRNKSEFESYSRLISDLENYCDIKMKLAFCPNT